MQLFFSVPFYCAARGRSASRPLLIVTVGAFNTLYQFWIHTRHDRQAGPLEAVLNTPSHHRVHHGSDPKYIDRNHARHADHLGPAVRHLPARGRGAGLRHHHPLASWNPLWANVQYYAELLRVAWRTRRWSDKLRIFLAGPGWRPADVPFEPVPYTPVAGLKYDAAPPAGMALWALAQFLLGLGAAIAVIFLGPRLSGAQQAAVGLFAVWSLVAAGAAFDRRGWLIVAEPLRWAGAALAAGFLGAPPWGLRSAAVLVLLGAGSVALVARRRAALGGAAGAKLPVIAG